MKIAILIVTLLFVCAAGFSQQSFYYKVSMQPSKYNKASKLYVAYEIAGVKFVDSLVFDKQKAQFQKRIPQPVAATVYTNFSQMGSQSVMLANNTLSIFLSDTAIRINKSILQTKFLFLTQNDRIRPNYFPLYGQLSSKNDTASLNKLAIIFDSLKQDDVKKAYRFFKANKTSLLSLFSFYRFTTFFADYSKVEQDFKLLPSWAKNSPDGKNILSKIQGAKGAQISTAAKNFIQQSSTGQNISLSQFNDKYILLDFWASWCAPCRKQHPDLKKVYEAFKDKNFEIVEVSLDSDKNDWLTAIKKDDIKWLNISDLKGQQNDIAVQYGVQSIPANFLISPNGIIIGKNLSVEELSKQLSSILNN